MHIDHYNFGQIGIDDHSYDADVSVFPDHVQERWWRREGHRLARQDLETVLADVPQILVIGTGYYGRMKVPEETIDSLRAAGRWLRPHGADRTRGPWPRQRPPASGCEQHRQALLPPQGLVSRSSDGRATLSYAAKTAVSTFYAMIPSPTTGR